MTWLGHLTVLVLVNWSADAGRYGPCKFNYFFDEIVGSCTDCAVPCHILTSHLCRSECPHWSPDVPTDIPVTQQPRERSKVTKLNVSQSSKNKDKMSDSSIVLTFTGVIVLVLVIVTVLTTVVFNSQHQRAAHMRGDSETGELAHLQRQDDQQNDADEDLRVHSNDEDEDLREHANNEDEDLREHTNDEDLREHANDEGGDLREDEDHFPQQEQNDENNVEAQLDTSSHQPHLACIGH